jgi:hypothetical protein
MLEAFPNRRVGAIVASISSTFVRDERIDHIPVCWPSRAVRNIITANQVPIAGNEKIGVFPMSGATCNVSFSDRECTYLGP